MDAGTIILRELICRGYTLRAEGGKLLVNPASRLTTDERADITAHRDGIIAALEEESGKGVPEPAFTPAPEVPATAKLYAQNERGQPCEPSDPKCWLWTYSGAAEWWYVKTHPVPGGAIKAEKT